MRLPLIQGREAVPVRLIPIITSAWLGPESLSGILANKLNVGGWHYASDFGEIEVEVFDEEIGCTERSTKTGADLIGLQPRDNGISAYHLNDVKTAAKMRASEWDVVCRDIHLLEKVLRKQEEKNGVPQSMESVWRLEATKVLPPGVFLWRQDMDMLWQRHTDSYGITSAEHTDFRKAVNYDAYIRPDYQSLVWEGFEHLGSLSGPAEQETTTSFSKPNLKALESLLKMTIAMAIDAYGYNPLQNKNPFPQELTRIIEKEGLNIDVDTVRKWLKEGAALLPRSEKP